MTGNDDQERARWLENCHKGIEFPRRRFLKAAGVAANASLLGLGVTGMATAESFTDTLAHPRVQEAQKAWEKGFRGQPERTVGLICHGLEARHPDLGPWNGVRAVPDGDGGLKLVREHLERLDVDEDIRIFSGSFGPNVGMQRNSHGPFTAPDNVQRVEAHLGPAFPGFVSRGLRFLLETYPEGDTVVQFQGTSPHSAIATWDIEAGEKYQFVAETTFPNNAAAFYTIEANYQTQTEDTEVVSDPFGDVNPDNLTADTPKVLGWYNEDWELSEATAKPRSGPRGPGGDPHGRSTSLASIMTGSGRASVPDEETVTELDSPIILGPGDVHTFSIQAEPGRGVYGSAYGDNIELTLEGPNGNELETSTHIIHEGGNFRYNIMVENLTVHDSGIETYKVHIHPQQRHAHVFGTRRQPSTYAKVERASAGAFKKPEDTSGDRTEENSPALYSGVAPNSGLIGLNGMYKTRDSMQRLAQDFAEKFNLRALHVAMGFGKRPGHAGGKFSTPESMKSIAAAGILPISQTDDVAPASQADREAANADEAISVVETGPNDGVWAGSEPAEPPILDEDGEGIYRKPDVTAPGGNYLNYLKSAKNGKGLLGEDEQPPIRDYHRQGTVRQAPMVVGQASLVAQALEEEAPEGIALPPPADAQMEDTMRLKQTILATASETPFTARPWHKRTPSYNFGGWDRVEGWGRVNIDASVEAAARDLTPGRSESENESPAQGADRARAQRKRGNPRATNGRSTETITIHDTVGLDVPRHSRAVAGHIAGEPGKYKVSVSFSEYTGDETLRAAAPPHIDLFVYDAENPAKHGTPNIVAKARAKNGSTSLEFTVAKDSDGISEGGTYYVVAKLVNVPGAYNTLDIKAHIELSVGRK